MSLLLIFAIGVAQAQPTFIARFLPPESAKAFDYGVKKDSVFSLPLAEMLEYASKASGLVKFNLQIGKYIFPMALTKTADASNEPSQKVSLQELGARGLKKASLLLTPECVTGFFSTDRAVFNIDIPFSGGKGVPGLHILSRREQVRQKKVNQADTDPPPCGMIEFEYGLQYDQALVDAFSNFPNPDETAKSFAQGVAGDAQQIWASILPSTVLLSLSEVWIAEAKSPDVIYSNNINTWQSQIINDWTENRPCVKLNGIFYISGRLTTVPGVTYKGANLFCETPTENTNRSSIISALIGGFNSSVTGGILAHELGHQLTLNHEDAVCNQSCTGTNLLLMCPSGPNPPAMSDCMRTIFNGYFTGDRCQCASVFTPAPACEKSPRCYAEITAADVDNPHPTKVCTGSDVMNFSATVEGGCNTATNTTIRVRYRKDLMSVAGISPFSDYFNHVETFLAGGKEYEELSARNPDGSPKLETIALNSTINLHFTARYNPSQALEIQPHSADIYLGAWPSNSMRSVPIRPYFPLTVQPGQTVLDVFPVNTGIASGHNYLQINGDLEFPFFYTYPTQYINPRPMYFVIDTPPPTPSTSGVNTYRFEGLHLLMGAGNKIHMNGDTRIQLLNGSLEGCATMWKGIELEDGSSAELFNNEVKDAQYALHIKGYAIVSAQKTNFENNNLAVYGVIPHNFPSPSIKLSGNTYRSSPGTWKQSYTGQSPAPVNNKGYAGIYLENVSLLNINGYTSPIGGGATDNLFQNLHNGIVVNRVNLNVAKSVFKDITTSALSSGYPLNTTGNGIFCTNGSLTQQGFGDAANSPVSFESCHTAVRANFSMLQVSLNHIIKANFGVRASNTTLKTFTVEHNRIAARDAGIFLHQYAKVPNGCKVSANHVTMTGNSAGVGIRLGGNNLATHIGGNVSDNEVHIQNAAKGIEMQLANQLSVHNNDVYLENSSVNYAGIQANGGSQNGVLCNAVTGSDSLSSTSIRAYQGMSAPAHEWGCNTMSGAPIGMEFAGACDGSDIRGNVFAGVGTGLQIGLAPSTGDAYTGPQSHRGNIWDDASVGVGASYLGNIFQVGQSEFVVDNSILDPITGDDIYKPDAISGPQLWFQTQSAPNGTYSCSSVQQPGYPTNCQPITFTPLRSTRDARQIAGDGIKGDYFQDALQWSTRRHLYRQILEHGNTYGSDTSVLHLLNDAQYTNVRAYGDLEQTLRGTYSVSSADSQQMVDAQLQISDLLLRITRIDSLLNDTSWTYVQRQSLYAQKDTLLVQAQNFIALYGDLNDRLLDDRTTAGNTLLNQYASLSAPSVFEQNEKAVADIYLQTFARDRHDLSATRIQTLESVAFQCPIAGGDAVFLAREMLAAIDTVVRLYDDAALCQNAQKLSGNQYLASAIGGFQLSPNPASGLLHLQYELGTSGRYQFHLTNLLGQNCLTVALKSGRQQESLVMSSLPEGVYFWHILKEAYVIQQGKLVVKR